MHCVQSPKSSTDKFLIAQGKLSIILKLYKSLVTLQAALQLLVTALTSVVAEPSRAGDWCSPQATCDVRNTEPIPHDIIKTLSYSD